MSERKQPSKLQWKLNLFIGLVLVLVLYVAANGVAFRHYFRKNVLIASSYTRVGGQTVNLLGELAGPLTIVNYVSNGGDEITQMIAADLNTLLDEYAYYGGRGKGRVSVRRVDPYTDLEGAKKLAAEYKLTSEENVLIVSYQGQHRVLPYADLANVDTSQLGVGGPPRLESFKAEDAISTAIQSLLQGKKSKVYFLSGHGEYDPDATEREGYSILKSYLERQNSSVAKLKLAELPRIPADADLVVIAGPKLRYQDYELAVLQNYLRDRGDGNGGRLILMLDPATSDPGLEKFAADFGVTFQNDLVMAQFATLGQTKVVPNAIVSIYPDHPAVAWLKNSALTINLGPARSLAIGAPGNEERARNAAITPLAKTPEMFWGETDYQGGKLEFDAGKDLAGPLTVAVAIDTASIGGGQVQLKGAKLVLVGGGQFLLNQVIGPEQVDFFVNISNWMMAGKPLGIAPKVAKEFTVTLDRRRQTTLMTVLLLFPLAGVAAAAAVWFRRRG